MVFCNSYNGFIVTIILSIITISYQVDEPTSLVGASGESFYFNLKGGEPNEVFEVQTTLLALKNYTIHVSNIPSNFGFIIVQVHGYIHEIALAYPSNYTSNNFFVKGTNVGLLESKTLMQMATFQLSNPNPLNVSAMINVVGYSKTTPIPGGCNMVFNVEVAPYLELNYNDSIIEVTSQPAQSDTYDSNCNRNTLTYEIYHLYQLERDFSMESYFKHLKTMMTVNSIRAHGRKVLAPLVGTNQKKRYSAYPGTGSVYAVIVSETQMGVTKSAAYVPIHTYACSTIRLNGSCNVLNTTSTKTIAATIFCLGMFLCFHGHVAKNTEMYLMSSLLSGVFVAYRSHDAVNVPILRALGFGLIWLLIWSCCCTSYFSRIVTYTACGITITSFAYYAGLGDVQLLENDTNFWLLFASLAFLSVVIFHVGEHKSSILGCSIVGAYLAIVPIDHYVGSNLKYAFINILRRGVVENFNLATIDPPFQFRDMIIVVLFLSLIVIGFNCQHYKFKQQQADSLDSPPHNFQYFDPSFNENAPALVHEEPCVSPYSFRFDPTSPGSDSVFTSPHPQTLAQIGTFGYPQASVSHPPAILSDATIRFMPASLRCNPLFRAQTQHKPPFLTAHTSTPRVPKEDSDSDRDAPPPPYDSIHTNYNLLPESRGIEGVTSEKS